MLKIINHSKINGHIFNVYDKEFIIAKMVEEGEDYTIWIAPTKYTGWGAAVASIAHSFVVKLGRKLKEVSVVNGKFCYTLKSNVDNEKMYILEYLQSSELFIEAMEYLTKHYIDNGKIA
jgi:hypothetical protein